MKNNTSGKYRFLIPVSLLNLKQQLEHNGYVNEAKYHLPKFFYIIHHLRETVVINKKYDKYSFIPMHSGIMENLLGKSYYKNILNILQYFGIIECKGKQYIVGSKSKEYRLRSNYVDESFTHYYDSSAFSNKLINYNNTIVQNYLNKKEYHFLYYNLTSLSFDLQKLEDFINDYLLKLKVDIKVQGFPLKTTSEIIEELNDVNIKVNKKEFYSYKREVNSIKIINFFSSNNTLCSLTPKRIKKEITGTAVKKTKTFPSEYSKEKFSSYIISICKILNKEWFFKVDRKGYRVHNNLTNLNGELRKCLLLDDSSNICNIDHVGSQPLLLAVLCLEYYKKRNILIPQDVIKYLAINLNGDIYQYMILKNKGIHKDSMPEDEFEKVRKEFKKEFYKLILFGKVYFNNPLLKVFKEEFPSVFEVIREIKKNDYKQLAIQLQRLESSMMVGVIEKLISTNPYINILTIHDSYFTTTENVDLVKIVIKERFEKVYKITLTDRNLKVEKYNDKLEEELRDELLRKVMQQAQEKQIEEYKSINLMNTQLGLNVEIGLDLEETDNERTYDRVGIWDDWE